MVQKGNPAMLSVQQIVERATFMGYVISAGTWCCSSRWLRGWELGAHALIGGKVAAGMNFPAP